ncbi:MAG: hypothetical protein CMH56_00325 [Myxococcales bacterium]|nr:hypothetical protein [Myxococcales bacterium]|tara:strand:+ start:2188 stop:2817 length:630 start_codon:yes stop_codon:yes gene_type:complete
MQKVAFAFFMTVLMAGCTPPKPKSNAGTPGPVTGECKVGDTIGFIINGTPAPGKGCRDDGERAQQYIFQQFEIVDNGTPQKGLKRLQPDPAEVEVRANNLVALPSGTGCAIEGDWRIYLKPPVENGEEIKMFLTYNFKTRFVNGRLTGTGSTVLEVFDLEETNLMEPSCKEPFELVDNVPADFNGPSPAVPSPSSPPAGGPPPGSGFGG